MSKRVLYREYDDDGNLIRLECCKCGEIKTVDNFNKNKTQKDGYKNECKLCTKEYKKQYRIENKEKIRKYQRQYHERYKEENKEKIGENSYKYRKNNKEKIREINKKYYQENKEKINKRNRQYYQENKEKLNKLKRQYYQENKEKLLNKNNQYYQENKVKFKEYHNQYYKENKEKIAEYHRQYYKENKEKMFEHYKNNKDKICKDRIKHYKDVTNQEIKKIYENVSKQLYPNNGIQYGIIYGVHCKVTDRWYIGQTRKTFNLRYYGDFFKYKLDRLSEDNPKLELLQYDIEKYGKENFEIFEVIDVAFSEKELDEKECYYIDYYKAYDKGYNSNRGNIFKHEKSKRKEVI